jgi:hypothetical protein
MYTNCVYEPFVDNFDDAAPSIVAPTPGSIVTLRLLNDDAISTTATTEPLAGTVGNVMLNAADVELARTISLTYAV